MPAKVRCGHCKEYIDKETAIRNGVQSFCSTEHAYASKPKKRSKRNPMPDGRREEVLARDGFRCILCGSRSDLHVHHVRYGNHDRSHERSNLVTLCGWHHNLGTDCVHSNKAKWQPILLEYLRKRERG